MEYYCIDRFEGDKAVLLDDETGETERIVLTNDLPPQSAEGDLLVWDGKQYIKDFERTSAAAAEAAALLKKVTHRD